MNHRNTRQKQIIMEALKGADHPTATELCEIVQAENPGISRATVFRDLSLFAEEGSVQKVTLSDGEARFDANIKPHAHAKCVCCGRIYDVFEDKVSFMLGEEDLGGFEIYSATIEFSVKCPACIAAEKALIS
ncbi:MAG: transcriptional repressor [Clostridia bacterium]|nr:transcriptional repressor [Clostridia bacterium]